MHAQVTGLFYISEQVYIVVKVHNYNITMHHKHTFNYHDIVVSFQVLELFVLTEQLHHAGLQVQ